jgi:cytochrome c
MKPTILLSLGLGMIAGGLMAAGPSGADTFKAKCAACHGPDGSGQTAMGKAMKVKDLRSAEVQAASDQDIETLITTGRKPMPANNTLDAATLHALVEHVRSLAKN